MCVNVDIDIEFEVEKFAESLNHFINGENFICESGNFRRSGEYLPLLETFGTKYVRALEPLIREKMRSPENKGISRVVDRLNLNQNLLFEEFISPYLSCEPDPDFEYAKTEFLKAKRNVTKLFNRFCHFAFDFDFNPKRKEVICKNLETTINAIAACVVDSRYNRVGYDFMDLFRYYYKKEINNKESNNESKEVSSEETNENEKLNEEKSNVIKEFEFQIFDLRVKSFSTRQHKFCDHGNRFDEVLYFKNLKEFVRNVFLCELYNENTVLKNFCEEIYPWRELTEIVKPSFCDSYDYLTDIDFRIKINKEWYKETLIIKKKLTSNFNKLYKTFYKDRWVILENLDEIFDPIINEYEKDQENEINENESKEVSSERTNNKNEKNQENEINENEPKEVSSEETNNNDKDQENENEDNNTKKDPWFFIIRNAKVEVGV